MTARRIPHPYRGGPFSTPAALASGVTPRRLRRSDLEAPFRGVRVAVGTVDDLAARCHAYMVRADSDECFSHATAAQLWGLPLPIRLQRRRELDVSVFAPRFPPQAAGIVAHRISRSVEPRDRGGLPCTPPVETWVQLASVLSVDDLIVATDALMRRKHRLASAEELRVAAAKASRRPGVRKLRAALVEARAGTDSPQETRTRLIIVRSGLPEPLIGHTVHTERGEFVGTPDLAYPDFRIALEYEGEIHRTNDQVFADDLERAELFQDAGWRYVRITKEHLANPQRLVARVRNALIQRGWRP